MFLLSVLLRHATFLKRAVIYINHQRSDRHNFQTTTTAALRLLLAVLQQPAAAAPTALASVCDGLSTNN
jgi:hypothetical protein